MRIKPIFLSALVLGVFGGVLATGCQTYDFEPVEPLAISQTTVTQRFMVREARPNLMLLVDTSGSMTAPVNPSLPACKLSDGTVCGSARDRPCNTAVCPTRWSELQGAMKDFLDSSGSIARFGLSTYPAGRSDSSCDPTSKVEVPLPAADVEDDVALLEDNARDVKNAILAIKNSSTTGEMVPMGGTPSSESLRFLGGLGEMQTATRPDFVLLLTDGLPNCNSAHPTPYPQCFCTLASCEAASVKQKGCIDDVDSVEAVKDLRDKEIQTIVIGFGADFDASTESGKRGAATLNAMAEVGGFERRCTKDSDCGTGDTCERGLCKRQFFQAANGAELASALRDIRKRLTIDPCLLGLDPSELPASQDLVVVYVNGERLPPGADTWSLTERGIIFTGATCERLDNSTVISPVDLEVRVVQRR